MMKPFATGFLILGLAGLGVMNVMPVNAFVMGTSFRPLPILRKLESPSNSPLPRGRSGISSLGIRAAWSQGVGELRGEKAEVEPAEQGRLLYEQGRWAEAIATWHLAFDHAAHDLDRSRLWSYLAMAHHKLEEWPEARQAIATSLEYLEHLSDSQTAAALHVRAQTLNTQAQLDVTQGRLDQALATWQQTTQIYQDLAYGSGVMGSLINQAKVLELNGYYRRACQTVLEAIAMDASRQHGTWDDQACDVSQDTLFSADTDHDALERLTAVLDRQANRDLQLLGWRTLGNVLRRVGKLEDAESLLQRSITVATDENLTHHHGLGVFSLAQVEGDRYEQAMFRYKQTQRHQDRQSALDFANQALAHYVDIQAAPLQHPTSPMGTANALITHAQIQQFILLAQVYTDLHRQGNLKLAEDLYPQLQIQLQTQLQTIRQSIETDADSHRLPSRTDIYSQITVVQSVMNLRQFPHMVGRPSDHELAEWLAQIHQQATMLNDRDAESYALGTLGRLYEYQAQDSIGLSELRSDRLALWQQAQQLTAAALASAQASQSWHIAYQWQWQLGRIHNALGYTEQSLQYYQAAASTLRTVRQDLLVIDAEVQFSFRDDVEPLYREWVSLLVAAPGSDLDRNVSTDSGLSIVQHPTQERLQQAIQAIDALHLSELENFLSCNLTPIVALSEPQMDDQAAVVYPIILPDELVVIVRSPHANTLHFHRVAISEEDVDNTLRQFRQHLERRYTTRSFFAHSQQVYDWLIRPFESVLDQQAIHTLVFVSDGGLRNLPMAALHNGDRFLIEDYAIAVSPGLQLPASSPLGNTDLGVLTFGLSKIRQNFPPHTGFSSLTYVEPEVAAIQTQVDHRTLLNQAFTRDSLEDLIRSIPFPIVHLATHGQFSSDPTNTFLLAWDQQITVDDLSSILQGRAEQNIGPIELLVLSACKTADGDSRATLGLAGIAIQSGARSTLASLWYVDDQSTSELMQQFYETLASSSAPVSRAEALRLAQVELLNTPGYQAPTFWAPYVLVGNWL